MKDLKSLSIKYTNNKLEVLDQQELPGNETWLEAKSPEDMIAIIKALKVRGAPLIGVAASLSLADYAEKGASQEQLKAAAQALRESRPTAVNLMICLDRMLKALENDQPLGACAEKIFEEDVELCDRIAENGQDFIEDGDNILTHGNTGGLATAGVGTALGVIRKAHESGKKIHVYVDETRPLLQGGRLTTWELEKLGIPYTLICDNMAATLMAQGKVQKVIVGADRIATNGDFANKIGTYNLGVLCFYHRIPFYVAAPYTTIDPDCESGAQIPIEGRADQEVRGVKGSFGDVTWAPEKAPTFNPAFDVTPHEFTSAWILDTKAYSLDEVKSGSLIRSK